MENSAEKNIANDYKVVSFRNATSFDFTPEMGCMYDGRPVNGSSGKPGIVAGETKMLPYHVGMRLAINLAKQALLKNASNKVEKDAEGNPMVKPIWDEVSLNEYKNSFIEELYSEEKPAAQTQTDLLFARISALEAMVKGNDKKPPMDEFGAQNGELEPPKESLANAVVPPAEEDPSKKFKDKQEVITELEVRGIPHDKRASKEKLEALLK